LVKTPTPPIPPHKKPRTTASRGTTDGAAYSRSGRRRVTATSRAKAPSSKNGASAVSIGPHSLYGDGCGCDT
jgi:hypothetical protein